MYLVSEAFLQAVQGNTWKYYWTGKITTAGGVEYPFDQAFNGFETIGTAYGMMALCSTACGVELAQTQAEIEALPNGSELLSIYLENDIETYWCAVFYGTGARWIFLHQLGQETGIPPVWGDSGGGDPVEASVFQ